jgi:hypothetical protein
LFLCPAQALLVCQYQGELLNGRFPVSHALTSSIGNRNCRVTGTVMTQDLTGWFLRMRVSPFGIAPTAIDWPDGRP